MTSTGREAALRASALGTQAFAEGRLRYALEAYREATAALTPAEDDLAPALYENLGLACFNLGFYKSAEHAFLRALDGDFTSRLQSLCFLIHCLAVDGQYAFAQECLTHFELAYGQQHPLGWTDENLEEQHQEQRRERARDIPC